MNPTEFPTGSSMFSFLEEIWPYCRSITGNGVRSTLQAIKQHLPDLRIHEFPSGSSALDWTIPDEWNISRASVSTLSGEVLIDVAANNLHIVGYSVPFNGIVSRVELLEHIHTLKDQPDVIPYVTSYYKKRWGFCVPHRDLVRFSDEYYHVQIDSRLEPGSLSIGEWVLPGTSSREILFSTYCCHPSMANDQLSGIGLAVFLACWLREQPERRYTYRFLFLPEMIGSATYLEHHREWLKEKVIAAFNLTCVGDEHTWSYLPSRSGGTLSDKAVQHLLDFYTQESQHYTWNDRGSDESMFCAPGIDIPMVSLMRSKYGTFDAYHTSADRLGETVTAKGLQESFDMYLRLLTALDQNGYPITKILGEPQLGKRGLYPDLSIKGSTDGVKQLLNVLSYCDGQHDLFDIGNKARVNVEEVLALMELFVKHDLVEICDEPSKK
jgi:aminopeptidase-like protein